MEQKEKQARDAEVRSESSPRGRVAILRYRSCPAAAAALNTLGRGAVTVSDDDDDDEAERAAANDSNEEQVWSGSQPVNTW